MYFMLHQLMHIALGSMFMCCSETPVFNYRCLITPVFNYRCLITPVFNYIPVVAFS